jgi:hypothetical protein
MKRYMEGGSNMVGTVAKRNLKSEHWGVGFDFQLYLSNFILFFGSTGA